MIHYNARQGQLTPCGIRIGDLAQRMLNFTTDVEEVTCGRCLDSLAGSVATDLVDLPRSAFTVRVLDELLWKLAPFAQDIQIDRPTEYGKVHVRIFADVEGDWAGALERTITDAVQARSPMGAVVKVEIFPPEAP